MLPDIVKYAGGAKGRYANCPQTMQQTKLATELTKKAMQKGKSLRQQTYSLEL